LCAAVPYGCARFLKIRTTSRSRLPARALALQVRTQSAVQVRLGKPDLPASPSHGPPWGRLARGSRLVNSAAGNGQLAERPRRGDPPVIAF